jgi:hypothetical protein
LRWQCPARPISPDISGRSCPWCRAAFTHARAAEGPVSGGRSIQTEAGIGCCAKNEARPSAIP